MKIIKISEDLVPLSRRQHKVLGLIVVCVFQFLFFFAPALAADAVADEMEGVKVNVTKSTADPIVAALIQEANAQAEEVITEPYVGIRPEPVAQPDVEKKTEYKVIHTSTHTMTAYNSDPAQTDSTPCITANGFDVCEHGVEDTIAANFLKFGTKVRIPELFGDRVFVVRDRMNKRYSDRVDVWMLEKTDARKFGVRKAKIEIVEEIKS